jgi:hypothetical protein
MCRITAASWVLLGWVLGCPRLPSGAKRPLAARGASRLLAALRRRIALRRKRVIGQARPDQKQSRSGSKRLAFRLSLVAALAGTTTISGRAQAKVATISRGDSWSVKRRCSGLQRRALCATAGRRQTVSLSYSVCDVSQLRSQRALGRLNGARGEERRDFPHQDKWLVGSGSNRLSGNHSRSHLIDSKTIPGRRPNVLQRERKFENLLARQAALEPSFSVNLKNLWVSLAIPKRDRKHLSVTIWRFLGGILRWFQPSFVDLRRPSLRRSGPSVALIEPPCKSSFAPMRGTARGSPPFG